jgi:3D (Asp-Asp-Asp) domain-containing protein
MLPEGTRVRVLGGPSFDATGTDWYQLSGFSGPSVSGWSSGEFLAQVAPSPASASTVGAATSTGHSFSARITAYTYQTPGNGAHGSITRSGTPVRWGVLAVDPRVIPLGSRVQIEGFNDVFIAEDTGGGVIGNHVEIFYGDYGSAIRFGVQVRTVTVLP